MRPQDRYTYENAGFNGFMLRSQKSNPDAQNLRSGISKGANTINFDMQQIAGAMGDNLSIGRLKLQGRKGRMAVTDETDTTEVGWVGDLTE